MTGQRGYANLAAACLDEADRSGDLDYRSRQAGYSQLNALRGIGWALLALDDRFAAVLDAADDRNTRLEEIADAVALLHREPRLSLRQRLSGLAWRWWGARRAVRAWRAEHDGQPPVETALLAGEDIALVRQALAEADERHRALGASRGCACADPGKRALDAALADAYGELWARLAGSDAS